MPDIAGLKLIVPTSVAGSGVSVSASGKVTFTAATSVSVNGCFTSSYDNYLIVIRHLGSTAGQIAVNLRLRAAGTDASGTNYTGQSLYVSSTTVAAGRGTSLTSLYVTNTDNTHRNGVHCYLYGPFLAQPTATRSVTVESTSGATLNDYANTHSLSTSYDGFTLLVASGTMTGALTIYGLSQ